MCDAEGWEDAADEAQAITPLHRRGYILQHEDHNDEETACDEVEEECEDLGIDIRGEDE